MVAVTVSASTPDLRPGLPRPSATRLARLARLV